jgi:predicted ArsR family transcriptional regulator
MNWIETIVGGTRGQLLSLLRRSRRSINEAAALLGISDNAVRTHIAAMQRDGMVKSAGVERATGGKPAQLYEITPEAEEMYPKAYAFVLNALVQLLEERRGGDEVTELLREVGARAAAGTVRSGEGEEARVTAAAEVLRQLGGDVEVERTDDGWKIRGYGCPLSAVVAEREMVCVLAESLIAEITGLTVRECCEREGRPRCAFEVGAGATTADSGSRPVR